MNPRCKGTTVCDSVYIWHSVKGYPEGRLTLSNSIDLQFAHDVDDLAEAAWSEEEKEEEKHGP